MTPKHNSIFKHTILWSLFFVPALLLSTPNLSIGFIITSVLVSIYYLLLNKQLININRFDILVGTCLSFYFLGALPVALEDGSTARYFQGGARLLLCLPIYLALSHYLKITKLNIRKHLEFGVVVGSTGTLVVAIYQYFYLSMPRVDGFLFSINFGYLSCSLAFLAFTFSFNSTRKWWLICAFVMSIVSVNLTFTRGAIFAIPLLLVLYTTIQFKDISKKLVLGIVIVFSTSSYIAYTHSNSFKQRINFTIYEFSNIASGNINQAISSGDRLQYWFGAIEAFKKSPLIGLPYDEREALNQELFLTGKMGERAASITRGHAHSQYFEMLATNGSLGLISIVTTLFLPFILFIRHHISGRSDWALPGAIFVAGFAIFGLTEVPLTANLIGSYYGFMLAVFLANISAEKYHWEQTHRQ